MRISNQLIVYFIIVYGVSCLRHKYVTEERTGINLGTTDILDDGKETRIGETGTSSTVKASNTNPFSATLGLKDWGPIQLTALMKKHPDGVRSYLENGICKVTEEVVDYKINSVLNISVGTYIFDYETNEDMIYFISSTSKVTAVQVFQNEGGFVKKAEFRIKWTIESIEKILKSEHGVGASDAGMAFYKSHKMLLIPTDVALLAIDSETGKLRQIPNGEYVPKKQIMSVEILEGYMFIAYEFDGIYVYDLRNIQKVKLMGVLAKQDFGKTGDEKLIINHMIGHHHYIEISSSPIYKKNPTRVNDSLFFAQYTPESREAYIQSNNMEFKFILVAEKSAVFLISIDTLINTGNFDLSILPHSLPVENVVRLSRFHNTIYTLSNDYSAINDPHSIKSTVNEIFLLSKDLLKWKNGVVPTADLFTVNRKLYYDKLIENVYSDDSYLYVIGSSTHYVYERSVPLEYRIEENNIGTYIEEPGMLGLVKIVLNGEPYLTSFGLESIKELQVVVSDPILTCGGQDFPQGEYILELNATTRNCPQKQLEHLDIKYSTKRLCRWTKRLVVQMESSVRSGDSEERNKREREEADKKTILSLKYEVIFMISLVIIVILVMLIGYVIRKHIETKKMYNKLKLEVSVSKDSRNFVRANSGPVTIEDDQKTPSRDEIQQGYNFEQGNGEEQYTDDN